MATTSWLSTLAGQSAGDFETSPTLDRTLSQQARRARHDRVERDRLFQLLAGKIWRFCRRYQFRSLDPWEFDDVVQLSYLVFVRLVDRWQPAVPSAPTGFLSYFFAIYPLRLADEVRRLTDGRRPDTVPLPDGDDPATVDPTRLLFDDLNARLAPEDQRMLQLHLVEDLPMTAVAKRLGFTRRTAHRRWQHIIEIGREEFKEVS